MESTLAEEPESYAATVVERESSDDGVDASGGDEDNLSSTSSTAPLLTPPEKQPSRLHRAYSTVFPLSSLSRNVLKCVLAYFLAELFTFVPVLSDLIGAPWDEGPVKNAHVVATVAVYVMPSRTIGGMLEADAFLLVGAIFATILVCGSMAMTVLFERLDLLELGHALVLILWLGGGYGLVAYVKVVMNKPSVSTACSLVSLICSGIITKEGAYHLGKFRTGAVEKVLLIAVVGAAISNAICFLVFPQSATDKLQADLNKTLDSFSTLVDLLTKTFLLDPDLSVRPSTLKSAIDAHQSTFTSLRTSLSQAKWEVFDSRIAGRHLTRAYDAAVSSMTTLAQGLTGMRGSCILQWDLMKAKEEGRFPDGNDIDDLSEEQKQMWDELVVLERFKEHVGPSLQTLSRTSISVLGLLRSSFVSSKNDSGRHDHRDDLEGGQTSAEQLVHLREELETALSIFKREHSRAVKILYRSLPAQTVYGVEGLEAATAAAEEEEDMGPNENLFRIYHFCFNFEEWASELLSLVSIFIYLRETQEAVEQEKDARRQKWGLLAAPVKVFTSLFGCAGRREGKVEQLGRQFARAMKTPRKKRRSAFPEIVDGALSSHQQSFDASAATHSFIARAKLAWWHLGWHLRQNNLRFAIKTGAGVAVLSSAAFIPQLRPIWLSWRGEWSLISFFVVAAPALGDANFLAAGRILGTALGATVALGCYTAFPDNPYVLPVLGALFSAPCFFVAITRPQYAPSSRFVLLTFNLTCLYAFNLREVDLDVAEIAFHRFIAVVFGVVYGVFIQAWIWPFEARRELRKSLSEFFLNASYLYERLVRIYSAPPPSLTLPATRHNLTADPNERTSLFPKQARQDLDAASGDFVAMEVELQLLLIKISGLLAATKHEPRLKGPFPVDAYKQVLTCCQNILDSLTAVARMTDRQAWFAVIRRDFVVPVNVERREMVGNIILYFSILSSAVSLKTPLPAYLPPAAEARDRLVARLRELEVVKKRLVRGGSESLLYVAYLGSIKDVIFQLEELGRSFQSLFGIIGGTTVDDFEALFRDLPDEEARVGVDAERASNDESSV